MIFGVDLGTRRVAVSAPGELWVFRSDTESTREKRRFRSEIEAGTELGQRALEAIGEVFGYTGHHFFFERPFPRMNVKTAIGQALSAGALLTQLPGDYHQIYPPSLWKKEIVGHGSAKPEHYRAWLEEHQPQVAHAAGEDIDLVAASCIALYGEHVLAQAGDL